MVERFQSIPAIFVDLDGTLINGNSIKIFMEKMPYMLIKNGNVRCGLMALGLMAARAFRAISHKKMKWHLTRIAREWLNPGDWEAIENSILLKLNRDVRDFLEMHRARGFKIYMATAAMSDYAVGIGDRLGFERTLATDFHPRQADYKELRGNMKRDAILRLAEEDNLELAVFLTDHHDDLPTLESFPGRKIMVNPSEKTLSRLPRDLKYEFFTEVFPEERRR